MMNQASVRSTSLMKKGMMISIIAMASCPVVARCAIQKAMG